MPFSSGTNPYDASAPIASKRPNIFRSVVFLLLSAGVLLIFIALLGDWRREHNILAQLRSHAAVYESRLGESAVLPLNLELDVPRDPKSRLLEGWLSPADAKLLRAADRPVLAAWTVALPSVLGADGRGVIYFDHGRFEVKWIPLKQFDTSLADQVAELRRLAASTP